MKRIAAIRLMLILMLIPLMGASCDSNNENSNNPDTMPPIISGIIVSNITTNTATISWVTDELATSNVDYGHTYSGAYGSRTPNPTDNIADNTSHSVNLSGLYKNTTYHFRVSSADVKNNKAVSEDKTFITSDTATDTIPPVISRIAVSNLTENTAIISWTTDELATSNIEYGLTSSYGFSTLNVDTTADNTGHSLELTGLSSNTTYHYRVKSEDASGNEALSDDYTFTTTNITSDTTSPIISGITIDNLTKNTATIIWVTNESSTGQVEYGTTVAYGKTSNLDNTLLNSHSINLSGLKPKTTYHFRVKSNDFAGNEAVSDDYSFSTNSQITNLNS